MKAILLATLATLALGFGEPASAIIARPQQPGVLSNAEASYFRVRPDIVDLPASPAVVASVGPAKALVILIDFPDRPADRDSHTPAYFKAKLFGAGKSSLRSYFDEVSYGRFVLDGDVAGWFESDCAHLDIVNRDGVAGTGDDYGLDISGDAIAPAICGFPLNIWGLVKNAAELASHEIDLAAYDNDGPDGVAHSGDDDGYVDALFVVHAGIGAELWGSVPGSENFIWSLQSNLDYYTPTRGTAFDGVHVGAFIIVPELGEIGVFAHEFCHLLGLPDLYNSATGNSVVGPLCLMDVGAWLGPQANGSVPCHLSAPMKYMLGWLEPDKICLGCPGGASAADAAEIHPLGTTESGYSLLDNPGGMDWTEDGSGAGEYFMLENRRPGYGYYEAYLSGSGMLIWKVDESQPTNNDPTHRLAEVIQADGEATPSDGTGSLPGEASDFWPGTLGRDEFTPYSVPSSSLAGGRFSGVAVRNIEESGALVIADLAVGLPSRGRAYAYPNPYNLEGLRSGAPLRIVFVPETGPPEPNGFEVTIFDAEGNPLRHLDEPDDEVLPDGVGLWNGLDDRGQMVEAGLYLYSVRSSGQEATGVVAIER
jgi:immune inhibitor A